MKRFLLILLCAVGVVATSCDEFGKELDGDLIEFLEGADNLSLNFPSEGVATHEIRFSALYDWTATTSEEWIHITPESGRAGTECVLYVSLDENDTYDERSGKVSLSLQETSLDLEISQQAKNGFILSPSTVQLPQSGGAFNVTVQTNIDLEYEIKADWIKSAESRALSDATFRFEAEVNSTTEPRNGEIIFTGGGKSATLIVTQSQTNVITLSSSTVEVDGKGGTFSVEVSSNVEYSVVIEDGCDWISQVDSRAVETTTLNFNVQENTEDTERSATITISGGELEESITITQEPKTNPTHCQILYTSSDSKVVTPNKTDVFGANIVSNTYENGQGVITFDGVVTSIGEYAFFGCSKVTSLVIPDGATLIGASAFKNCISMENITIPDSITSVGDYAFQYCKCLTAFYGGLASNDKRCIIIDGGLCAFAPADLTEYTIPNGVTSIGRDAFAGCRNLTSVTIPNSVTSIVSDAFYECSGLTAFYGKFASEDKRCLIVNGALCAFAPAGLTEYTIPDNAISIRSRVFLHCNSLTSVTISDSVTSIGMYAFNLCSNLESVTIGNSVNYIGSGAFLSCSKLINVYCRATIPPNGADNMFTYHDGTSYVNIGCTIYVPTASVEAYKSASYWSDYASDIVGYDFEDTNTNSKIYYTSSDGKVVTPYKTDVFGANIVSNTYENGQGIIKFDNNVTKIGETAFKDCTTLATLTIPESTTTIGIKAFDNCRFASIDIPDSVTTIEDYAFARCSNLSSFTLPDSVTTLGRGLFFECNNLGAFYGKYASSDHRLLTQNNTVIAFAPKGVTEYTIPSGVTTVGNRLFYRCAELQNVNLPESLVNIEPYAFAACSSMTTVIIPKNVATIGSCAFKNDKALVSVYCFAATPPTLEDNEVFSGNASDRKIYVPEASVEAYKSAQDWSEYADHIGAIGSDPGSKLYYTSSDGKVVTPYRTDFFGANIVSNTYENGQGVIIFDGAISAIGNYAFYNCNSLTSITIPDNVTLIKHRAFEGCSGLTSIAIPENVTEIESWAFYGCSSLKSVIIPGSINLISNGVFQECSSLTSVTIPNSVTSIKAQAFYYCSSLTSITIPDGVTSIGDYAFRYCSSLTSITIPDSVSSIGQRALSGCSSLTAIYGKFASEDNRCLIIDGVLESFAPVGLTSYVIPKGVTSIGDMTFISSGLTSITIPSSVISIGSQAFALCKSLTSVTIPNSVTSIGAGAFQDCSNLTEVYITDLSAWCKMEYRGIFDDDSNYYVGTNPLENGAKLYLNGNLVTDLVIPSSIIEVKKYLFSGCSSLKSVTIPNGIASVGEYAFYNCKSLTSVNIPSSVISIGAGAFAVCSSLTSVTIPDSVTSIGHRAFYYCDSLTSVYCKPTTPPTAGNYIFHGKASGCKIYVPTASVEAYKAAQYWSDYADDIVGYDF